VATEALVIQAGLPLVAGAGAAAECYVRRIMTDLPIRAPVESQEFYRRVVGLESVMDLAWIVSLADPVRPRGPSQTVEPRPVRTRAAALCPSRSTTWWPAYVASSPATRTVRSSTC
jgi:hypothetical protein